MKRRNLISIVLETELNRFLEVFSNFFNCWCEDVNGALLYIDAEIKRKRNIPA
jgi:hypothetical protein